MLNAKIKMQNAKFRSGFATIKILGIETSCDETAAAVVAGDGKNPPLILSNVVASQVKIHAQTGGIVPEVAARAHAEKIVPVIQAALEKSKCKMQNAKLQIKMQNEINAIAVTVRPGLIGSLLIGVETAKTLAYIFDKPIIPINHIEGHIYSNFIRNNFQFPISNFQTNFNDQNSNDQKIEFPALCLIVSGGHTSLTLMKDHGKYQEIGSTRDDAAGEAFDKTAKLLGLSYPGGPSISKAAASINSKFEARNPKQYLNSKFKILKLPRPMINSDDFDFSFSGLKTAVLYLVRSIQDSYPSIERSESRSSSSRLRSNNKETMLLRNEIAREFQQAVVDVLIAKTLKAAKKYAVKTVILGGGVSANQLLRQTLEFEIKKHLPLVTCRLPLVALSTDNAAMIAAAGYYHYIRKDYADWRKISIDANLKL